MIGGASSLNIGASQESREGHYIEEETPNGIFTPDGTFMFYNADSTLESKLPNYLKNNIDVLVKYKGLTFY